MHNGLPFWYRITQVALEKRPLNECSNSCDICVKQKIKNKIKCIFEEFIIKKQNKTYNCTSKETKLVKNSQLSNANFNFQIHFNVNANFFIRTKSILEKGPSNECAFHKIAYKTFVE